MMNSIYLFLAAFSLLSLPLAAQSPDCINDDTDQPCCNDQICTDPRTGQAVNDERSPMLNKFDWMADGITVYHPSANGGFTFNGGPLVMTNPFITFAEYLQHINYHNFDFPERIKANLDFHPENGWELLHKNNGFEPDEQTYLPVADRRDGPHFILYNRYTGKLRLFAAFNNREGNDKIVTTLKFLLPSGKNELKPSALLSLNTNIAQPLDKPTAVKQVSHGSEFPNNLFFTADFPMAYDPCVCHNHSNLNITFDGMDEMAVQMEGRLIGTSVPLDDTGNDPLLNGRDFITSVLTDEGFTINGGALTYHNADALVERWKAPPELGILEKLGIDAFKAVLKIGGSSLDAITGGVLSSVTSDLLTPAYKKITSDTNKLKIGIGLSVASNFADNLISDIFPERPKVPNISFIEAEMSLTGSVTDVDPLHGTDIVFAVPGSKDTRDENIVPDAKYPAYNEALGVFALLETPKVAKTRQKFLANHVFDGTYTTDTWVFYDDYKLTDNLKYTFNPSAEVDIQKSVLKAGIIVKSDCMKKLTANGVPQLDSNWRKIYTIDSMPAYATPFFPFGCLPKGAFRMSNPGGYVTSYYETFPPMCSENVYIKVVLDIVHKPNKYGKVNRTLQVFTYPVDLSIDDGFTSSNPPSLNSDVEQIPFALEIIEDTYYAATTLVQAWNTIAIKANITVAPGATVTFRAGSGIAVVDASSLNNDQIKLEIGDPDICDPVPPQTPAQVKSFCGSNLYKANQLQTLVADEPQTGADSPQNHSTDEGVRYDNYLGGAHPNPAAASFAIPYTVTSPGRVEMALFNSFGQNIGTIVDNPNHQKGRYEVRVDASQFPAGVYFYTMRTGCFTQMGKVILVR